MLGQAVSQYSCVVKFNFKQKEKKNDFQAE